MKPSLLLVVPTLDSFLLLPRLIHSLQAQSWLYWRLIFVDGPSGLEHRRWLSSCCNAEPRCSWIEQNPQYGPGIFGAMNQGFALARPDDWLLFWGSDDWCASSHVFASAISAIQANDSNPDLLVCQGRYVDQANDVFLRTTRFFPSALLSRSSYRRALWFGSTPPHQSTFIGPGARSKLARYAEGFRLSADLDYFIQLSRFSDLRVSCLDLELVHMADGGVSAQQSHRRLLEVRCAYQRAFGFLWWFPFFTRYVRRLFSLLGFHR